MSIWSDKKSKPISLSKVELGNFIFGVDRFRGFFDFVSGFRSGKPDLIEHRLIIGEDRPGRLDRDGVETSVLKAGRFGVNPFGNAGFIIGFHVFRLVNDQPVRDIVGGG